MHDTAILFDLDGTLVHSLPDLANAANRMRAGLNLPSLSLEQVQACVGDGARMLVARALPEDLFSEAQLTRFLRYYQQSLHHRTRPYAGIVELLNRLPSRRLAVVTNKPQAMTRQLLRHLDLERNFKVVIGGDRYAEKKPHPLPLQKALATLEAEPCQALMVGDHHTDLRAGRAAGMKTCFCSWGYGNDGGEHPDFRVDSVAELAVLLGTQRG